MMKTIENIQAQTTEDNLIMRWVEWRIQQYYQDDSNLFLKMKWRTETPSQATPRIPGKLMTFKD